MSVVEGDLQTAPIDPLSLPGPSADSPFGISPEQLHYFLRECIRRGALIRASLEAAASSERSAHLAEILDLTSGGGPGWQAVAPGASGVHSHHSSVTDQRANVVLDSIRAPPRRILSQRGIHYMAEILISMGFEVRNAQSNEGVAKCLGKLLKSSRRKGRPNPDPFEEARKRIFGTNEEFTEFKQLPKSHVSFHDQQTSIKVLRGSHLSEEIAPITEILVGDVIRLFMRDIIPGDGIIASTAGSSSFEVTEGELLGTTGGDATGGDDEGVAIKKGAGMEESHLLAGTRVKIGVADLLVLGVGERTYYYDIIGSKLADGGHKKCLMM